MTGAARRLMGPSPLAPVLLRKQDRRQQASRDQLLQRVRREFQEMPRLRLTCEQAQRLFGLRVDVCTRVLDALSGDGVLWKGKDGRYALSGQ